MNLRTLINWGYGVGIIALPMLYTSLMLWTNQPVEWQIVILTVFIVSPILAFRAAIRSIEAQLESVHVLVRHTASSTSGPTRANSSH